MSSLIAEDSPTLTMPSTAESFSGTCDIEIVGPASQDQENTSNAGSRTSLSLVELSDEISKQGLSNVAIRRVCSGYENIALILCRRCVDLSSY